MTTQVMRENVLTDDVLHVADEGEVFRGGYKAVLEYHTYANEWSDKRHVRRFRTLENAEKYITKKYPEEE